MEFKDILKGLRYKKGITQEQLADALNIPASTIRRYESTEDSLPHKDRLKTIADYFGVSVDHLLGRESENNHHLSNQTTETERVIREIVEKYDIDLTSPGIRDKLELLIQVVADDLQAKKK